MPERPTVTTQIFGDPVVAKVIVDAVVGLYYGDVDRRQPVVSLYLSDEGLARRLADAINAAIRGNK